MITNEIESMFWTMPYGFTNPTRLYHPAGTKTLIYNYKTESQQQFIWLKAIGTLEMASGADPLRENILIQIEVRDRQETVFEQEMTFDEMFGSPQFPSENYPRLVDSNTQIIITITNNSGVDATYDWLLWGTKIFLDRPYNKKQLIQDVWTQPRYSNLAWAKSEFNNFEGGVLILPAGSPTNPSHIVCESIQMHQPFLAQYLIAKQKPIEARFQLYSRVDNQYFFSNPVLLRLIAGDAGRPFMFPQWVPVNRYDIINIEAWNYETTQQTVPFGIRGVKAEGILPYNLGKYAR